MGQEILYCWNCNIRILGSELEKGKAIQVGHRAACADCAPQLLAGLAPEERQASQARTAKPAPVPPRAIPRASSSVSIRVPAKAAGPNLALVAGIGAGVVVLIVAVVVLSAGGAPPPPPAERPKADAPPPPSPKEKAAREAVARAKALPEGDIEARIRAWQDVVFAVEGTTVLEEAKRELAAAVARRAEAVEAEFRRLDEEARVPLRAEDYAKALAILEAGRSRRSEADWRLRIDKLAAEIRKRAEGALGPLAARAVEAKRRSADAEVRAIESQVAGWGLPGAVEEVRRALATVAQAGVYQQGADADGLVVVEAERFSANVPSGEQHWAPVTGPADLVGAAMKSLPEGAPTYMNDYAARAPRLEYRIQFVKTGTHYLWWRAASASDQANSIHAGLDGAAPPTLMDLRFSASGKWNWQAKLQGGKPASFEVDRPGVRTLQIYAREFGASIDRLLITTNPKYAPSGPGPAESPR